MLCIQKPIRADDFVTAQKKREILTGGFAALLIVCAVAARVITRGHRGAVYFLPVSLLRSFIYIGLIYWAYDVVGHFALAAHCPGAGAAVSGGDGGAVRILAVHPHRQILLCRHACRHPVSLVQE